ncbi:hypothetical protein V3C99_002173 [Haemonchus contortus]
MCLGMLFNSCFRIFVAPVRLFLGRGYKIPWVQKVDELCQVAQLIAILQVDTAALLISVERLIATMFIRRYEHMFTSIEHRLIFTTLLIFTLYGASFYLYIGRGDVFLEANQITMIVMSYLMMATNIIGLVLLRITQVLSKRHLTSPDRALSMSFQCKENLRVVQLISPLCILLFFTRLCQFGFRLYAYYVGIGWGAFCLRLLAHMYNLSLALSVFLTPLLLIILQPQLLAIFYKRDTRKLSGIEDDHNKNTVMYFEDLKKAWEL